jgi:hypothetical protein
LNCPYVDSQFNCGVLAFFFSPWHPENWRVSRRCSLRSKGISINMSWNKVTRFVEQSRSGLINVLSVDNHVKRKEYEQRVAEYEQRIAELRVKPRSPPMYFKRISNQKLMGLNMDMMAHVFSYLNAEEICAFRTCGKFTDACFHVVRDSLWQLQCVHDFGVEHLQTDQSGAITNNYAKYLHNHHAVLDHEYQHVKSLAHCYQALSIYFSRNNNCHGVFGMVCDLFWADDERVAMALSRNRYWALPTIIVDTEQRVYEFKKVTSACVRNGPASFLTLSMAAQSFQDASEEYRFMDNDPRTLAIPGFVGYAINLLRMKKELEFLKFTVLPILFKNLMVFETMEAKDNFEMTLTAAERVSFRGIGLDETVDGNVATVNTSQARVYPCFKWRESRGCYFRNHKFMNNSGSASNQNRAKICTHSCSATHSSCMCRDGSNNEALRNSNSPVMNAAFCTNVARPLGGNNSPTNENITANSIFGTSMMASFVQGIERQLSTTKQTLLSGSAAGSTQNTTAGDCFYVSKVIDDLEKRVERAKSCYTVVRYTY